MSCNGEVVIVREAAVSDPAPNSPEWPVLSAAQTVALIGQHVACKRSGRLPGLFMAAARRVAAVAGRQIGPWLEEGGDEWPGAASHFGFVVVDDDRGCTVYELKQKVVTIDDLDRAVQKLAGRPERVDNYVVITTDRIDPVVGDYAATLYEATGGTEFVVLDCLGFVRHFLHLFHRRRAAFLDAYQSLLLDEPDSAVGLPLKEAFLALRRAAVAPD